MLPRYQIEKILPALAFIATLALFIGYFELTAWHLVSFLVALIGCSVWLYGLISLGNAFSTLIQTSTLVTSGIYAKIRHPIYVGVSLILIGFSGMLRSKVLAIVTIPVIAVLFIRAHYEEKKLTAEFGQEYVTYKQRSWF